MSSPQNNVLNDWQDGLENDQNAVISENVSDFTIEQKLSKNKEETFDQNENRTKRDLLKSSKDHLLEPDPLSIKWQPLATQVAGHALGLVDIGNRLVLKRLQAPPRGTRELNLYKNVFDNSCCEPELIELRSFLPFYYGSKVIDETVYVQLENLTSGYKRPCVVDIKMGRVSYDQEATPEKRDSELKKYPPALKLGFRFSGMRVYNKNKEVDHYLEKQLYKLTEETILTEGFGLFFGLHNCDLRRDAIKATLNRLKVIESWFLKQRKLSFIASSLLIVYDDTKLCDDPVSPSQNINLHVENNGESKTVMTCDESNNMSINLSTHPQPSFQDRGEHLATDQTGSCAEPLCKKVKLMDSLTGSESDTRDCEDKSDHCDNNPTSNSDHNLVGVHLIDLAHVYPSDDIDHNFLFGLQKLISLLKDLVHIKDIY